MGRTREGERRENPEFSADKRLVEKTSGTMSLRLVQKKNVVIEINNGGGEGKPRGWRELPLVGGGLERGWLRL